MKYEETFAGPTLTVSFALPAGWELGETEPGNDFFIGWVVPFETLSCLEILNEQGEAVGYVGFNETMPLDNGAPDETKYRLNYFRIKSHGFFLLDEELALDAPTDGLRGFYRVLRQTEEEEVGVCGVFYDRLHETIDPQKKNSWLYNYAITDVLRQVDRYVAMEFLSKMVTKEQVEGIAASLSVSY